MSVAYTLDPGVYIVCPTTSRPYEGRYYLRIFAERSATVEPIV